MSTEPQKNKVFRGDAARLLAVEYMAYEMMIKVARKGAAQHPIGFAGVFIEEVSTWIGVHLTISANSKPDWMAVVGPDARALGDLAAACLPEALIGPKLFHVQTLSKPPSD